MSERRYRMTADVGFIGGEATATLECVECGHQLLDDMDAMAEGFTVEDLGKIPCGCERTEEKT